MPNDTPAARVERFVRDLLLPLYEEISVSPRMHAKQRTMTIVTAPTSDDPVIADALVQLAANRRHTSELATSDDAGEWIGPTLVITEPAAKRAPYAHPQAGRFYLASLFRLPGDGRVFASPWVMYWMRFNDRMHAFAHRYDNVIADHPIEALTRKELVNHALNAITFFDIGAFSATSPL